METSGQEKQTTSYDEEKQFLYSYASKEEFIRDYKKVYERKARAKHIYLLILSEIKEAVSDDNVKQLKKLSDFIDYIHDIEDEVSLKNYYEDANNPIKGSNLVILACKHNKLKILEYLLCSDCKILSNLSVDIRGNPILPYDEDEMCHNAFYYAILSGNCKLLNVLINKWPDSYFVNHLEELDEILSRAYEELKLKNVLLSEEIEIFVEDKIINLRFFSNAYGKDRTVKCNVNKIRDRIELVLQNINLLKEEYSNKEKVDEKFVFIAKFIAQNIHILKRQLKSTYIRLPWEEIEFCLVSFVYSHIKLQEEINLFYKAILNKSKLLSHLENFAEKLKEEKDIMEGVDICKLSNFPNLKREKVVAGIINECSEFEGLYSDYKQTRDIHSLQKISDYIKLALSADPSQREGQILITRVLQVIGEYLKNTLESPKLSSTTSELLVLTLPKNTRQIVIDLRNSLSHAYSLSKRKEIDNMDVNFFIGVKNDTKKIDSVITDILFKNKISIIRKLLKTFIVTESLDEMKEVAEILSNFKLDSETRENFSMIEHERLENFIEELMKNIPDKTNHEKELFNQMNSIINFEKHKLVNMRTDYNSKFRLLPVFEQRKNDYNDQSVNKEMKFLADKLLADIPLQMETHSLMEIAELSRQILNIVTSRLNDEKLNKLKRITYEIFYIAEFGANNLKWIEELKEKLNEKGTFIPMYKQMERLSKTEENDNKHLSFKLAELKSIFQNYVLSNKTDEKLSSYKRNKKLQAVVEMLVLDIMSILSRSEKCLENNLHFLDDNSPLLNGKCLRNHLAHDNALVDVLLSDPSISVILNAKMLISEDVIKRQKKLGKLVKDDPSALRDKLNQSLISISNQKTMFSALEEKNIEGVKSCLRKGADINARNINLSTALHIAAYGSSLEIIKFILNEKLSANVKDLDGQIPLHIAAANGRSNIVEFFIKEVGVYVDDKAYNGKTALHNAAENGHKDTVETLLRNKANTNIKDKLGFAPLHYAILNNHIDIVKILLKMEVNVNVNDINSGFTLLHLAAGRGHLDLVHFLLRNKADVNARNYEGTTPLHSAALTGHLEVVSALILKGANVDARTAGGCTPLHYAIENGHEKVANILLKHGVNVNIVDGIYNNTPLHYAAREGYEKIVQALLKNKANTNIATVEGLTALHLAAQSGHLKVAAVLLEHGVNIHAKSNTNSTPLHFAAKRGHTEVAELLIKYGAEVNGKAYNNLTPLHVAALGGHKDIINLLIRNNASVRTLDIMGSTPLHATAMNGCKDTIDLLINNNAEIDARNNNGMTPLHVAALYRCKDAVSILIKNKATVDARANYGLTPLFAALIGGNKDIVNLLIKNNANVNAKGIDDSTPLHFAVEKGIKEIVQVLIDNGANVNARCHNITPMLHAIKLNNKEIVQVLIENGVSVNGEFGEPLKLAVLGSNMDIVEILLRNNADVNVNDSEGHTLLHLAAKTGHKRIMNVLITRGAKVDAMTIHKETPLHVAAAEGHRDIAEMLIVNKANVNIKSIDDTPMHRAAGCGHSDVVEILLRNGAKINVKDSDNRTPLELAVAHGHLQVVKMLLEHEKADMNAKGNGGYTILHIASQEDNIEMVKYLVDEGCDIRAKNTFGSKPIHIAAREGFKDAVEFYLSKGLSVDELGGDSQTLLHFAAMKGRLEVVKYLIELSADVNSKDINGCTPVHFASHFGYKDVIEVLLKNGAIYNSSNKLHKKPIDMTEHKNVINLLASTDKLFESVKHNSPLEIVKNIKAGAFINARSVDCGMPLHYAAWKGYDEVVRVSLQYKADPNAVGNKRCTPLHYAAKFSHLKIVKSLLSHGAVYNALSDSGKTPSDFTADRDITNLFELIDKSFEKVQKDDVKVINHLNGIKDIDTLKAVMSACNRENKSLVDAAIHSNFSKVEQLKQISQGDLSNQIDDALMLLSKGNFQNAMSIFKNVLERRTKILGPDNPGTLDIQVYIGIVLFKQGAYHESLNVLEEVFQKQKQMLGVNDKDTLNTRSTIALVLHYLGKNEEAFDIYQEVYEKQKKILGTNHSDTLKTQFHWGLVLNALGRYEEALNINKSNFKMREKTLGKLNSATISAQNNIALVLANQGKYEESLQIYKEVFEKKKLCLGISHADTLRTLGNIGGVLANQDKHHEALKVFQEILDIQKKVLSNNHPETLTTQYNIGNIFFAQGKYNSALKVYSECIDKLKAVFEPNHPTVLDILKKMETIHYTFKYKSSGGSQKPNIQQHLQNNIFIAASKGDIQTVQELLKDGYDVNNKDIDGRTPLHYAVSSGQIDTVHFLLKNGADVSHVTNKGNTPLHTASSNCFKEIVDVLLEHVSRDKLCELINAKTTSSGSTSLHVAVKVGSLEVVKSLLKHGAAYKIKNSEGKTPLDLSTDQKVSNLLKLIEELFQDSKNGNIVAFDKLRAVKHDEFLAIANSRNNQGKTLLQVAIAFGHKNFASKLLEMLKKLDQNC